MRSRTELVTTTFEESDEDDYSPDNDSDSEEDWRPTKKRPPKQPQREGGRKRKAASAAAASKAKRRLTKVSDDDTDNDDDDLESDDSDEDFEFTAASTSAKRPQSLPPKKQFVKVNQLDLLIKKSDLIALDWFKNNRLCLWRRDEQTNLLQKYLRVKTAPDEAKPEEEQLLFTSSSVYSSWDDQHISDFIDVKVNCLDPNNRRIKLDDLEAIKKISLELQVENPSLPSDEEKNIAESESETKTEEHDLEQREKGTHLLES